MIVARYIVVDCDTREVLNAYVVESAQEWPPQARQMATLLDMHKEYSVGDTYDGELPQQPNGHDNDSRY